jgi:hypothetical protein
MLESEALPPGLGVVLEGGFKGDVAARVSQGIDSQGFEVVGDEDVHGNTSREETRQFPTR